MRFTNTYILLACSALLVASCQHKQAIMKSETEKPLLESVAPEVSGIVHRNDLVETEDFNYLTYTYMYNGGGVATGDINNDGLVDIYLSSNQTEGNLYLNKGDFKFEDITESSGVYAWQGWKTGVTMADINGDGWLDIYICRAGLGPGEERTNLVYINNRNLTFSERSAELGLIDSSHSISANVFDYDLDGDMDIFVVNHTSEFHLTSAMFWMETAQKFKFGECHLFKQFGDGTFKDVSKEAGIVSAPDFSLSASIFDFNNDGWPDIFVCNDFWGSDYFYVNNGDGTFTETNKNMLSRNCMFSMGSDATDLNNDGLIDIVAVDMMPDDNRRQKSRYNQFSQETFRMVSRVGHHKQFSRNMLFYGVDGGTFAEAGMLSGIASTDWSWAVIGADIDNDGWKDMLVTNGIKREVHDLDYTQKKFGEFDMAGIAPSLTNKLAITEGMPIEWVPNFAYRNKGDLTFEDVSGKWGFTQALCSQGMALADLDNDGDLDVVISNTDTIATLYRNRTNEVSPNKYVQVQLKGRGKNPFGIGAKVTLYAGNGIQYQELQSTRGYQSSSQPTLHFGLGAAKTIDSIVVVWPDRTTKTVTDIKPNSVISIEQTGSKPARPNLALQGGKPFVAEKGIFPALTHQESVFNDFDVDRLVPHKLSAEGPALTAADVNGDGNDDLFLGSGKGHVSTLWLSTSTGYVKAPAQPWNNDLSFEIINAVFFDTNGDGLTDLYLASGSNEYNEDDACQQDRLYLNKGKGEFAYMPNALPQMHTSTKAVAVGDYDGDGDLDLFVGGFVLPRKYGLTPRSYLLINENGTYKDATRNLAPSLYEPGMVTTAVWADVDGDKALDLVLAGEYMPLSIYSNKKGKLSPQVLAENGLENTNGWWRSLVAHDFDGDGDMDFVAGNYGNNIIFECSSEAPGILYVNDFDKNGTSDPVFTCEIKGVRAPFLGRDLFCEHMPEYNNKFLTSTIYANMPFDSMFAPDLLANAHKAYLTELRSGYIENLGNGMFTFKPFAPLVQMAPVHGLQLLDANNDGFMDILIAGNSNSDHFLYGDADAAQGLLLLNDGKGNFTYKSARETGFKANKVAKGIAKVNFGGNTYYIVANNNDTAGIFKFSPAAVN